MNICEWYTTGVSDTVVLRPIQHLGVMSTAFYRLDDIIIYI